MASLTSLTSLPLARGQALNEKCVSPVEDVDEAVEAKASILSSLFTPVSSFCMTRDISLRI